MKDTKKKYKLHTHASGKLMLFGEHSVVYGYPCIVTSVNRFISVSIDLHKGKTDVVDAPQSNDTRFVASILHNMRDRYELNTHFSIKTRSDFSYNYGLGSSSAVVVAIAKAINNLCKLKLNKKQLYNVCYESVLDVQKVGSGFDVAAAAYGSTIYYIKGGKKINKISTNLKTILVFYTGVKADTVKIVQKLKCKMQNNKSKVEIYKVFEEITDIVKEAKIALKDQNWTLIGQLMNQNQQLLKQLGVSTKKIDTLIGTAINNGAWGAKLSGAGGGDCIIVVCPINKKKRIISSIENTGGKYLPIELNIKA